MAVYTQLSAEILGELIAQYDVGELVSAKGIAEGVSNSNWLIETTQARFILTMYERRIELEDLPFFLGLLDHLSDMNCPVPRTIHDKEGAAFRMMADPANPDGPQKAVALIEFLPGASVEHPTPDQARNVGKVLATMHLQAQSFDGTRTNNLGPQSWESILEECGPQAMAEINTDLPRTIADAQAVARDWPQDLPSSIIHSDLFPDNVLMVEDEVGGLIDFYFACNDAMAYDIAVTHAAWCFDETGSDFRADIGHALIEGYQSVRPLEPSERNALPLLAQGAALRFISSRTQDWLDTPDDALVTRKDPMQFVKRLDFYHDFGADVFGRALSSTVKSEKIAAKLLAQKAEVEDLGERAEWDETDETET